MIDGAQVMCQDRRYMLRTLSGTENIVQRIILANPLCSDSRDIVRGCARARHGGRHEAQVPGD